MNEPFDAALPTPYADNWKRAERPGSEDGPRLTSYQAPGGEAIVFILKSFKFSGGQSLDTAEYPFDGLWSNEALNEKPQTLHVEGFIRGAEYIKTRNAFIEALRVKTGDGAPGFIDFPFWGRFPIVVVDYEIAENTDEKGQCAVSLAFKRAGVSIAERETALTDTAAGMETAAAGLEAAAVAAFEKQIAGNAGPQTLAQGFAKIKTELLDALGRVQAKQTLLNTISNEISGIAGLAAETVRAPQELARAVFNAAASIAGALAEIQNSLGLQASASGNADRPPYPAPARNNEQKVLSQFLSASGYSMDIPALTVRREKAKTVMENLYRISAFAAASRILARLDNSYQKTQGYWKLFQKLEASIDAGDPAVYAAVEAARIGASRSLSAREPGAEQKRYFDVPLPLLCMAQYLGCGEAKLRELNRVADSFVVRGSVSYV